jgi:hypothetical protein
MLKALKSLFARKVRAQKYGFMYEFFNTKMKKNTSIDCHLSNMHRIYRRLVDEFEYEITNDIGKDVLLQSVPPSYSETVEGYVMARNNDNFHQCIKQLRSLKVERAAEKFVEPKGICDIRCYKCFINTYVVLKYEMLIPVLLKIGYAE